MKLFCDCKTDEEKFDFFLSGRGVETGVIAPAISSDVAMAYHRCAEFKKERDALRAKIAEMEQQAPVGKAELMPGAAGFTMACFRAGAVPLGSKLYALPGAQAQPAPSVPDGWRPVSKEHTTLDSVDLQLANGSVLCGCVPQPDGDYWWEGPSGEVFIDPRYAPITHWRLSATPEAKPCP